MHSSAANTFFAGLECPWLPPIAFGVQPYLNLCKKFDEALKELEARYPHERPLISFEVRAKAFKKKRPK